MLREYINKYHSIIKNLMSNDHNSSWDEILDENLNNYKNARTELINSLIVSIRECDDIERLEFYAKQLEDANNLLESVVNHK